MKKTKILTVLGVLLAMGITACGGGEKQSEQPKSEEPASSEVQPASSDTAPKTSEGGTESSQGGGESSATHEHSFGEWGPGKAATYTELGTEERVCACGEKEERDVNTVPYNIDAASEVIKLNSDNKKVSQFTYNNGAAKVAAVPMKEISGGFQTDAVEGEAEKWTIGADANQAAADTYKLSNSGTGMALLFKVNVSAALKGALISIGGKYSNNNPRHFSNEGDGGQNGDDPAKDGYRYYTKVNDGEFQHIAYNNLMSSVFGDGQSVCYMPLGKFDLNAGENLIYVRQGNLGYRVTLQGYLYVDLGASAEIGGTIPTHQHQAATAWSSDENEHWHVCTGSDCDEQGVKLDKAAHTFGPLVETSPAGCEEDGAGKYVCSVCGYEKTVVIPAAHDFGAATQVAAGEGTVGYDLSVCTKCNAKRIEVKLDDSMLASGSANKNDPAGYMKLKSNGQSWSFKFNYNSQAVGKIYQRGVMDGWPGNSSRYLFSGGSNGADDFELKVNNKVVDVSAYKNKTFAEAMPGETQEGGLSPLTDVESGANVFLANGENTVSYKRLASFNLALTHIVFVVQDFTHDHAAAAEWSSDENAHWHACTAAGCPVEGYRMDEAAHEFGEAYDVVEATCTAEGSYKKACSVCGYVKTFVTEKAAHTFGEGQTAVGDAVPHECSVCHAVAYELTMATAGKIKADVSWNVTGLEAGTYELNINACASSTTLPQNLNERYQYGFDGNYVTPASGSYASYGLGTGEAAANAQWSSAICQLVAAAAPAQFTVHWIGSGYSCFYVAVRLIKIA